MCSRNPRSYPQVTSQNYRTLQWLGSLLVWHSCFWTADTQTCLPLTVCWSAWWFYLLPPLQKTQTPQRSPQNQNLGKVRILSLNSEIIWTPNVVLSCPITILSSTITWKSESGRLLRTRSHTWWRLFNICEAMANELQRSKKEDLWSCWREAWPLLGWETNIHPKVDGVLWNQEGWDLQPENLQLRNWISGNLVLSFPTLIQNSQTCLDPGQSSPSLHTHQHEVPGPSVWRLHGVHEVHQSKS